MQTVTVTLGSVEYEVRELSARKNRKWRAEVKAEIAKLSGILDGKDLELSAENIKGLIDKASELVLETPDLIADLLFSYSPELRADQKRILDECYESELMNAFVAVLKLAFPFGELIGRLVGLGSNDGTTITS